MSYRINIFQCLKVGDMLLDSVRVCVVRVRNYTTASFFPLSLTLPVLKTTRFLGNLKPIMDILLQIFDENWLDDT